EAAQAGDAFAVAQLTELGTWLGEGAAQLAAVVDPGVIVLGGGVAAAGELLLAPMRSSYEAGLTGAGHRPVAELRLATLGNTAGLIGAADLARR
ncbi:ROK family protein, partial [Nocardioides jensenii]|uniref:ROK family protein n=1 Tax=Nocardioides jensenii TaxID=1843 RepID=UPI000A7805EC